MVVLLGTPKNVESPAVRLVAPEKFILSDPLITHSTAGVQEIDPPPAVTAVNPDVVDSVGVALMGTASGMMHAPVDAPNACPCTISPEIA